MNFRTIEFESRIKLQDTFRKIKSQVEDIVNQSINDSKQV